MKRVLGLVAASVLAASSFGLVAAQPSVAAPAVALVSADTIVNPDGVVVKKLPALASKRPDLKAKVSKGAPAPSGQLSTLATCDGLGTTGCYLYNVGSQSGLTKKGVQANVRIGGYTGQLDTTHDQHTLGEIAAQSADGNQIVEVGWTVDPGVNKIAGTSPPQGAYTARPFVFSWVNHNPTCYNGCGFVPTSGAPVTPGVTDLVAGSSTTMGIWHDDVQHDWWISWGSGWLGYYPDSQWTSATPSVTYNTVNLVQLFGEIASDESKPCSDFGNGYAPTDTTNAAKFSSTTFYNSDFSTDSASVNLTLQAKPSPAGSPYSAILGAGSPPSTTNLRSFYYGGPMWNAAGTGVGTRAAC